MKGKLKIIINIVFRILWGFFRFFGFIDFILGIEVGRVVVVLSVLSS